MPSFVQKLIILSSSTHEPTVKILPPTGLYYLLDLWCFAELLGRIEFKQDGESGFHNFHPVASLLSYLTKAPLVPDDTPVVNALAKQRAALENIMRACVGLPPENNMMLEFK